MLFGTRELRYWVLGPSLGTTVHRGSLRQEGHCFGNRPERISGLDGWVSTRLEKMYSPALRHLRMNLANANPTICGEAVAVVFRAMLGVTVKGLVQEICTISNQDLCTCSQ